MVDISWTSAFVSRAFALAARSWDSLASRQGWDEMWTLGGNSAILEKRGTGETVGDVGEEVSNKYVV